jgi:two-component system nitrogen regulation response regulator NtrX
VLIVDDAGPVVVLCVNVLQTFGYSVKGANRGEAALDLLRGFEVFEEARALYPDMPVVLVTGHATPEIMAEADQRGFHGVLLKPFTSEELRATVDKVLARRG